MKELLFLMHRIPYPPNKGDKIRSFYVLKHLAQHYHVHLGALIDDPADWDHVNSVRKYCAETYFARLSPEIQKLKSLAGFWRGEALTLTYFYNAALQAWVDCLLARGTVQQVLVYSSTMAQYVKGHRYRHLHRIMDFADVDSDKWLQFSRRKKWPLSWLYRREAETLLCFERAVAAEFAASVFITPEEMALFRSLAPEVAEHSIHCVGNGVDTVFFTPDRSYPYPYCPGEQVLVFTGAMDYWANVDAVCWFAKAVLPAIRREIPNVWFYIVGARPTSLVRRLENLPGVKVTGTVPDMRPYLAHAQAAVAPLRIARGVQNKVLEAMAMAKPILATRAAMYGIHSVSELDVLIADEADQLAFKAIDLLRKGDSTRWGKLGRDLVIRHYNWTANLSHFLDLLERHSWTPEGSRANLNNINADRGGADQVSSRERSVC